MQEHSRQVVSGAAPLRESEPTSDPSRAAPIAAKALTTFSVSADGETVFLGFADERGDDRMLALPALCIKEMLLSLPEMMRQSLQRKFRDSSLRLVYPVDAWSLEASTEAGRFILTLRTVDAFDVAFALHGTELSRIASLATEAEAAGLERIVKPN